MTDEQLGRVIQNAYNEGYEKAMVDVQSRARKAAEEIVETFDLKGFYEGSVSPSEYEEISKIIARKFE